MEIPAASNFKQETHQVAMGEKENYFSVVRLILNLQIKYQHLSILLIITRLKIKSPPQDESLLQL